MATVNIDLTESGWQDILTIGETELTNGNTYTLTILGNGTSDVCISDSTPDETLKGHPVNAYENFTFTYSGEKIWVKLSRVRPNISTVVLS